MSANCSNKHLVGWAPSHTLHPFQKSQVQVAEARTSRSDVFGEREPGPGPHECLIGTPQSKSK